MRSVAAGLRPRAIAQTPTTEKTKAMPATTQPAVRPTENTVHPVRQQAALHSQVHPAVPTRQRPFCPPSRSSSRTKWTCVRGKRDRRRFCHRASLVTFERFKGDTVWCPIEAAPFDLEWHVGDLVTQLYGSGGMSNG